jgi:hypothetical protein
MDTTNLVNINMVCINNQTTPYTHYASRISPIDSFMIRLANNFGRRCCLECRETEQASMRIRTGLRMISRYHGRSIVHADMLRYIEYRDNMRRMRARHLRFLVSDVEDLPLPKVLTNLMLSYRP